jgi:hypothetical protein
VQLAHLDPERRQIVARLRELATLGQDIRERLE